MGSIGDRAAAVGKVHHGGGARKCHGTAGHDPQVVVPLWLGKAQRAGHVLRIHDGAVLEQQCRASFPYNFGIVGITQFDPDPVHGKFIGGKVGHVGIQGEGIGIGASNLKVAVVPEADASGRRGCSAGLAWRSFLPTACKGCVEEKPVSETTT